MSLPEDADFLGRWSTRKLQARAGAEPTAEPGPDSEEPGRAEPRSEAASGKTDDEMLEELGLPDPDSLVKGDDFKAFMRAGVPARLRSRALRRLWLSDPVLANLDGLNDYDQDFTDAATVVPGLKTAYRVGRGFLRDEEEHTAPPEETEALAAAPAEDLAAGRETELDPVVAPPPERVPESGSPAAEDAASSPPDPDDGGAVASAPRAERMRFRFGTD
jgi:hypothetical protein